MKKIERAETTTHILEFMFHEIKNETEAKNVMLGVYKEDIFVFSRWVHPETFQPWIFFGIRNGDKVIDWPKYCAPMELTRGVWS